MKINKNAPIKLPLRINCANDTTIKITLLRSIHDKELIKMILYKALYGEALISYPYFNTDIAQTIGSLSTAKLVHFDWDKKKYYWGERLK